MGAADRAQGGEEGRGGEGGEVGWAGWGGRGGVGREGWGGEWWGGGGRDGVGEGAPWGGRGGRGWEKGQWDRWGRKWQVVEEAGQGGAGLLRSQGWVDYVICWGERRRVGEVGKGEGEALGRQGLGKGGDERSLVGSEAWPGRRDRVREEAQ